MQVNEKDRDQVASTKAFIYSYFVLIFWFVKEQNRVHACKLKAPIYPDKKTWKT